MTKLLAVGFDAPFKGVEIVGLRSKASILDADITILRPSLDAYRAAYGGEYMGKRSLDSRDSTALGEDAQHWQREVTAATAAGKTVVVFLGPSETVYFDTGGRERSGTGKNQRTITHVAPFHTYALLPTFGGVVNATGSEVRLVPPGDTLLADYWNHAKPFSPYSAYLDPFQHSVLMRTKTGDRAVAGMVQMGRGRMLLLPDVQLPEKLPAGFEQRFVGAILAMDRAVRSERTPPPDWSNEPRYLTAMERTIHEQITRTGAELEALKTRRTELRTALEAAGEFRALLYEKRSALEVAVRSALNVLGFKVTQHKHGDSEFDAVFEAAEGRCLGEIEGKDSRAIDIDKFRQLETNLQEDFAARDGATDYAHGVLFGNAQRLTTPDVRADFFTQKCHTAAVRARVALVRTPDLYTVAVYLREKPDADFAKACRVAIVTTEGKAVAFPSLPGRNPG